MEIELFREGLVVNSLEDEIAFDIAFNGFIFGDSKVELKSDGVSRERIHYYYDLIKEIIRGYSSRDVEVFRSFKLYSLVMKKAFSEVKKLDLVSSEARSSLAMAKHLNIISEARQRIDEVLGLRVQKSVSMQVPVPPINISPEDMEIIRKYVESA